MLPVWSPLGFLRRVGPVSLSGCLLALALGFLVFFLLGSAILPLKRTVTVEARTWQAEIVFSGSDNVWLLEGATQCGPDTACGPAGARTVRWPPGAAASVILRDDGVEVEVHGVGAIGLAEGTRFHFPPELFASLGVQVFTGALTLGEVPRSGRRAYLIQGRFGFRQRSPLASAVLRKSDVVLEGTLIPGDLVIPCRLGVFGSDCRDAAGRVREPVPMSGILALSPDPDAPGLEVTATSKLDRVALFTTGFGRANTREESSLIRPDWIDVVLASPTFLAVTLILTYVASILQTLANRRGEREAPPRAQAGDDAPDDASGTPR